MSSSKASNKLFAAPKQFTLAKLGELIRRWLTDQIPLFEAFLLALSLHVLSLPVLWVVGWALPWPKSPTITTIIEFDLRNWPNKVEPKKIIDIRDPLHNP